MSAHDEHRRPGGTTSEIPERSGVSLALVTSDATALLREALTLDEGDRASIAAELLASLPVPPTEFETDSDEWLAEIERRARAVVSGEATGMPWEDAKARLLGQSDTE